MAAAMSSACSASAPTMCAGVKPMLFSCLKLTQKFTTFSCARAGNGISNASSKLRVLLGPTQIARQRVFRARILRAKDNAMLGSWTNSPRCQVLLRYVKFVHMPYRGLTQVNHVLVSL